MIHIIDTEHPWDVYCISSGHTEVISCLEWDQSGKPLLLLLLACLLLCAFLSFTCFLGVFLSLCRITTVVGRRRRPDQMLVHVRSPGEQLGEHSVELCGRRSDCGSDLVAQWREARSACGDGNAASHLRSLVEGVMSTVHSVSLLICFSLALQISGRSSLG